MINESQRTVTEDVAVTETNKQRKKCEIETGTKEKEKCDKREFKQKTEELTVKLTLNVERGLQRVE